MQFSKWRSIATLFLIAASLWASIAHGAPANGPLSPQLLACSLKSSTWKIVDTVPGGGDTWVSGAASSYRASYLVGTFDQSGGSKGKWIVRRSLNRGDSWTTVDAFTPAPGTPARAYDVAVDPRDGGVYVVGGVIGMSSDVPYQPWIVRRSRDHGKTWVTVDNFSLPSAFVGPTRIAIDGNGVIYVVGYAEVIDPTGSTTGEVRGVIRRSTNRGSSWTTIDMGDWFAYLSAVAATPDGKVFIGGRRRIIRGVPELTWQVAYSPNGMTGWSIVDSFAAGGSIVGAKANTDGQLLVFGDGEDGTRKWLVRQARATTPATWTTVDDYRPLDFSIGFGHARAEGATFALDGEVYGTGYIIEPGPSGIEYQIRNGYPPTTLFGTSLTLAWWASGSALGEGFLRTSATTTTAEGDIITAYRQQVGTTTPEWVIVKLECK